MEVSEWFLNNGGRVAEGHYLYPLPGEAVFQGFSLFQGDAELRGEIMDAEQARQIYEDIVRRRADPAPESASGRPPRSRPGRSPRSRRAPSRGG